MWVKVTKDDCLSLHPLFILLIAKVDILQSTASHLLSLIYTRQSPVKHSNFKGHNYAATKLNSCCELQWRKCQLPSTYILKHYFFFDPFWEDIETCVPEPMHAELLRIEEDALHPYRDLHTVYDWVVEVADLLGLVVLTIWQLRELVEPVFSNIYDVVQLAICHGPSGLESAIVGTGDTELDSYGDAVLEGSLHCWPDDEWPHLSMSLNRLYLILMRRRANQLHSTTGRCQCDFLNS